MSLFTEDRIKKGYKENDHSFFTAMYKEFYPSMERFILYNSGDEEDAKDLFQEALMIVFRKIRNDNFTLSCSFLTYLYSIVKNLWLKELRTRRNRGIIINELEDIEDVDCHVNFENEFNLNVEYFIFRLHFNQLSKSCKQILKMFFDKISYKEIAEVLNLKSGGVVRRRKYRCKEQLIITIKNDNRYIERKKG